jgi:hypothetical protein
MTYTAKEIYAITPDENGWRKLPSGVFVTLGNGVKLGNDVKLGHNVTSLQLAEQFRQNYIAAAPEHIFVKWVTRSRKSPGWGQATPILYEAGSVVEAEGGANDQQCAPGLHVFRMGERPEWHGLCEADHDLIPLRVRVKSEDILFAGLPTMDAKLRVRRLEVLD